MAVRNYRELIAWQKAMDLVEGVYRLSRVFPADERFGLTSQLRRAVVSVPSNIAEGQRRGTAKELAHYLRIAHGSLREVETQLLIAKRLGFATSEHLQPLLDLASEVGRLINGSIRSIV